MDCARGPLYSVAGPRRAVTARLACPLLKGNYKHNQSRFTNQGALGTLKNGGRPCWPSVSTSRRSSRLWTVAEFGNRREAVRGCPSGHAEKPGLGRRHFGVNVSPEDQDGPSISISPRKPSDQKNVVWHPHRIEKLDVGRERGPGCIRSECLEDHPALVQIVRFWTSGSGGCAPRPPVWRP